MVYNTCRCSIASTTPLVNGGQVCAKVLQQTISDACAVKMNWSVQSFDMVPRCKGNGTAGKKKQVRCKRIR